MKYWDSAHVPRRGEYCEQRIAHVVLVGMQVFLYTMPAVHMARGGEIVNNVKLQNDDHH